MQRLMREPLLHFLLLGAALFVAFSFVRDDSAPRQAQTVVSAGKIEHLASPVKTRNFVRWGHPRTLDEKSTLINLCF